MITRTIIFSSGLKNMKFNLTFLNFKCREFDLSEMNKKKGSEIKGDLN